MPRTTIDYGIDLGTTNSAIAVRQGRHVEILRTPAGEEYIPSAVRIGRDGNVIVGRDAKQRYFYDPENAAVEFKLLMGTQTEKQFVQSGRKMKPEELSAEVLKELRRVAYSRLQEEAAGAVIGIPADFNTDAEEATKRAGALAGFREVRVIHEPIAAGMAYGVQNADHDALWLVYDLGGGTFDAALIRLHEGVLQITGHAGDKHLGGKDMDWDIVEQVFVPEVVRRHRLSGFERSNPQWRSAFAKLKLSAEEAKIALSTRSSYEVVVDRLLDDPSGRAVSFQMELNRSQIEAIAEPYILRTINICKKLLAEHHLTPQSIQKVILVGGPTLMPWLRERLQDPSRGLGIPLEVTVDPMTVVAQGLAIVASGIPLPPPAIGELPMGTMRISLDYRPVGDGHRVPVGGRVEAPPGVSLAGYTLEFVSTTSRQGWRSGQIPLQEDGKFLTVLQAEDVETNVYHLELGDPHGQRVPTEPAEIAYRIEPLGLGKEILTHTIGVALATGQTAPFLQRGVSLPARKTLGLRTVSPLSAGHSGNVLKVPVVEGEHPKADRNRLVGSLEIYGNEVERDLPRSSELEVTLEVDEHRTIRMTAYVPLLRKCFDVQLTLNPEKPDLTTLRDEFAKEKERFEKGRSDAIRLEVVRALEIIQQIEQEKRIPELERCLASSHTDIQALYRARDLLADLRALIDEIEEAMERARILDDANQWVSRIERILSGQISLSLSREEQSNLKVAKELLQSAIQRGDVSLLEIRIEEARQVYLEIVKKDPDFWRALFLSLKEVDPNTTKDPQQYAHWVSTGDRAFPHDVETLKKACVVLVGLQPDGIRLGWGSDVVLG